MHITTQQSMRAVADEQRLTWFGIDQDDLRIIARAGDVHAPLNRSSAVGTNEPTAAAVGVVDESKQSALAVRPKQIYSASSSSTSAPSPSRPAADIETVQPVAASDRGATWQGCYVRPSERQVQWRPPFGL